MIDIYELPTRRRVADTLRFRASEGTANPLVTLKSALGFCQDKTYRDVFYALADLIDRPTCHNFGREDGTNGEDYDFACSRCGHCSNITDPKYCPNCGAEVVE